MRRMLLLLTTMTIALLVASGVAVAAVLTFSNTSEIFIRDATLDPADPSGNTSIPRAAEPYPSEITVRGFSGPIRDVDVILKRFRHTFPEDVGVLLVGPEGQKVLLMSDVGGFHDVAGVKLVLSDEARASLPDLDEDGPITSGSYKPTQGTNADFQGCPVPADFPSPAPTSPYETSLSVFDGTDPNGIWQLYVLDDCDVDAGKIRGGWTLRIQAAVR
jgi:subtilisin-like proprotein convertase family protein